MRFLISGFGREFSVNEIFDKVVKGLGKRGEVQPVYKEAYRGEFPRTFADNAKARRVLGWKPRVELDNGLDLFVKWFMKVRRPL